MTTRASKIWLIALSLALVCILFPPRRDTEQGHDREGIPSRRFLWSGDLYEGSPAGFPGNHLTARIDLEKLTLELSALATVSIAIALASRCCRQKEKQL